jgi:hypothetical protein
MNSVDALLNVLMIRIRTGNSAGDAKNVLLETEAYEDDVHIH